MTQRHTNQGPQFDAPQQQSGRDGQAGDWSAQASSRPSHQGPSYGGQYSAWDAGGGQHGETRSGGQQGQFGAGGSGQWGGGTDYDSPRHQGRVQDADFHAQQGRSSPGGFDPRGPHGGFGGAGGSQGSLYGTGPGGFSHGPSQQRLEHQAWQREQSPAGLHGGVIPGQQGPYGDYGEVQGHRGGYWYGGQGSSPQGHERWEARQDRHDHFDPDYHQWREAQLRSFDDDYRQWRQERFRRFSDEFSQWRQARGGPGQQDNSQQAASSQGASSSSSPSTDQGTSGEKAK